MSVTKPRARAGSKPCLPSSSTSTTLLCFKSRCALSHVACCCLLCTRGCPRRRHLCLTPFALRQSGRSACGWVRGFEADMGRWGAGGGRAAAAPRSCSLSLMPPMCRVLASNGWCAGEGSPSKGGREKSSDGLSLSLSPLLSLSLSLSLCVRVCVCACVSLSLSLCFSLSLYRCSHERRT